MKIVHDSNDIRVWLSFDRCLLELIMSMASESLVLTFPHPPSVAKQPIQFFGFSGKFLLLSSLSPVFLYILPHFCTVYNLIIWTEAKMFNKLLLHKMKMVSISFPLPKPPHLEQQRNKLELDVKLEHIAFGTWEKITLYETISVVSRRSSYCSNNNNCGNIEIVMTVMSKLDVFVLFFFFAIYSLE